MTRQFVYAAAEVPITLDIRNDGQIWGSCGTRVGRCPDVPIAVHFCRRIGWRYTLNVVQQ